MNCLTEDQAITVQIINSFRDAAQHYLLDISEQQLYVYAQAGVTVFNAVLKSVFDVTLADRLPERVLPVSTSPPRDLHSVIADEFTEIRKLVQPGSRRQLQARAKLRGLAIIESSLQGIRSQPSQLELQRLVRLIQQKKSWQELFPGVASLRMDTEGTGLSVSIRITKKEGQAVTLVPEGTPGATVIAVKRVDELGYYSLGLNDLAEKLDMTRPKALALIHYLKLQESGEYFKIIRLGKSTFKRYSRKALEELRIALSNIDMDEVWRICSHRIRN